MWSVPVHWQKGKLEVRKKWSSRHFLTLIDCRPSRFMLWWSLCQQDSASVVCQLESIFYEWGMLIELLTDNNMAFPCKQFKKFLNDRGVHFRFWCAYAPAGNGIVERSHRSIKTIAARKQCSISEGVYWYNVTPEDNLSLATALADALHKYHIWVWGINTIPPLKHIILEEHIEWRTLSGFKLHMGDVQPSLGWAT